MFYLEVKYKYNNYLFLFPQYPDVFMEEKNTLYQNGTEGKTIFDRTLNYLNSKYSLRFNTISLEFEIKLIQDKKWADLNLNSLYIELIQSGIVRLQTNLDILV